jgi:hypothetical protein
MRRVLVTSSAVALIVLACAVVYVRTRDVPPQIRIVNEFIPGRSGRLSPHETMKASVDGAALSITYGRPRMRKRKIFGSLVPYGILWCPGADEATMIATDNPLRFGGLKLDAGEYSLWMLPEEDHWTLTFNSEAHTFHDRHDREADVGTIDMTRTALAEPVEQLTFTIDPDASGRGGVLAMEWETTRVAATFSVGQP